MFHWYIHDRYVPACTDQSWLLFPWQPLSLPLCAARPQTLTQAQSREPSKTPVMSFHVVLRSSKQTRRRNDVQRFGPTILFVLFFPLTQRYSHSFIFFLKTNDRGCYVSNLSYVLSRPIDCKHAHVRVCV